MSRKPGDLITKDPSSSEPQGFDWTEYLAELGTGIAISTSTWAVSGPDSALTTSSPTVLAGSLKTKVTLGGGTLGATYQVTNQIVTDSTPAVTDERSFSVLVEQR